MISLSNNLGVIKPLKLLHKNTDSNSSLRRVDLGTYFIFLHFQSAPSKWIDYEDIEVGKLIESSSTRNLFEGKYKGEEVYVERFKNQPTIQEIRTIYQKAIRQTKDFIGVTPVRGQPFCKITAAT